MIDKSYVIFSEVSMAINDTYMIFWEKMCSTKELGGLRILKTSKSSMTPFLPNGNGNSSPNLTAMDHDYQGKILQTSPGFEAQWM